MCKKERMCIMKVSRERLQIIGRMIGVLREEKRQNKQNSWTQIKFCENICSPNTLKSIESGKVGRSDDIYEQLLEKLGLKYGEYPLIDEAIEQVVNSLRTAIEFFDEEKIKKYCLMGMKVLDNAKVYIYYSDLYEIMSDVYKYYIEGIQIDEVKASHFIQLLPMYYLNLQDIMKILIFAGIRDKCICNMEIYKKYVNMLEIEESRLACMKINLMHYYYKTDESIKMINLGKELEGVFSKENNYIRLLDTYNGAISLMGYFDKTLVEQYTEQAMKVLNTYAIPENKKSEVFINIAGSYHGRKDYAEALNYYQEAIALKCEDLVLTYVMIADCQNHLGMPIKIPFMKKKILGKFPRELRILYNYFLLYSGEEVPPLLKQKILIKRIAPILQDPTTIDIFEFELKKLVKETGNYKDLSLFDEIISKNLNRTW